MINTVLFDCDGLLVDSESLGMQVAEQVCNEFGISLEEGELETFIGVTDKKWFQGLLSKKGLALDVSTLLNRQFELYERQLGSVDAFPGAKELPHMLLSQNCKLGLVSGSTRKQVEMILEALGLASVFGIIVTCDETGERSKPDPYGYQLALQGLKVSGEQAIVLEDAASGIQAALAAGIRVVGVRNAGMQDLSMATAHVGHLTDLFDLSPEEWIQVNSKHE